VRFLITGGGGGGLLNKHYATKAFAVGSGEIKTAADLAEAMRGDNILPPDAAFQAVFSTATVSRGYLARYYLRSLEMMAKGDSTPELIPNPSEEIVNLEHVLPQNPSQDWDVTEDVALGYFRRLGNLVLLQATTNSEIGNQPFVAKKRYYRESAFYLTSMVAKEREWGIVQIKKRQQYLSDLAVKTWPLQ
jgi:hypothetical protein